MIFRAIFSRFFDSLKYLLLHPIIIIRVVFITFAYGCLTDGINGCIAIFLSALIGIATVAFIKKINKNKILLLIAMFVLLNILFSSIYYFLYLERPSRYTISESILVDKYVNEYQQKLSELTTINKKMYLSAVLLNNPELSFNSINSKGFAKTPDFPVTDYYNCYIDVVQPPDMAPLYSVHFVSKKDEIVINENEFSAMGGMVGGAVLEAFIIPKTKDDFIVSIENMLDKFKYKQKKIDDELNDLIALRQNLKYIDFLYFSTITMTTTGYGDIIPNSKHVRVVVILQTLCGVLYIAYALSAFKSNSNISL